MVSFSCEVCNDTVIKKKLDGHKQRCRGAYFTCIDCSTTFNGNDYRQHTSCISEAEKYEKALYKGNKKKPVAKSEPIIDKKETKTEKKTTKSKSEEKKTKAESKSSALDKYVSKSDSLYKIAKKISKDNSKDLKDVLKQLKVEKSSDGSYVITL